MRLVIGSAMSWVLSTALTLSRIMLARQEGDGSMGLVSSGEANRQNALGTTPFDVLNLSSGEPLNIQLLGLDEVIIASDIIVNCHLQSVITTLSLPSWALRTIATVDSIRRAILIEQVIQGFRSRSQKRLQSQSLELTRESAILVAHESDSGQIVGIVEIYPEEEVYLCNLAVSPHMQRRGVARQLCLACERVAVQAWGKRSIRLNVVRRNAAAIALYESLGYKTRDNKQEASWEDFLLGNPHLLLYSKALS